MKIRHGFVSNSSTSSFLMYGVEFESVSDIFEDYDSDDESWDDPLEKLDCGSESNEWAVYLGSSWNEVGDDETGAQFKQRVEKEVTDALKSVGYEGKIPKFKTYREAWRS